MNINDLKRFSLEELTRDGFEAVDQAPKLYIIYRKNNEYFTYDIEKKKITYCWKGEIERSTDTNQHSQE